jgi:hypothetical protein
MRERMEKVSRVIGVVAILCCGPAANATVTYHFVNYPADQNGWTLSGTVTTNGKTGALATTDFVGASITVTKGTSTETWTPTAGIHVYGGVSVVGSTLVVSVVSGNGLSFTSGAMQELYYLMGSVNQYADTGSQMTTYWATNSPSMGGTNPWVVASQTLPGDANVDRIVNGSDLNTVLSDYNKSYSGNAWVFGDFDGNGLVNGADLNVVLSNYNQSMGVEAAVPEPSAFVLLGIGVMSILARARRLRQHRRAR